MAIQELADFGENESHMIRFALGTKSKGGLEEDFVTTAEILKVDRCHDTVGNRDECAFVRSNTSRAQSNIFHHAGAIAEAASITDTEYLISQHRDATEKVLDRLLSAETDGKAADAQSGQRCAHVESQIAEHCKNAEDEDDEFQDALAEQHERARTGVTASQCTTANAEQGPPDEAPDKPRHADDQCDRRGLEIVMTRPQRHAEIHRAPLMDDRASQQPGRT